MGRAGDEHQVVLLGEMNHVAAQIVQVLARLPDVAAHARAHLNHGLMHLGLDALLKAQLSLRQHLGLDVRPQIACFRINSLILLLNAQRKRWPHRKSSHLNANYIVLFLLARFFPAAFTSRFSAAFFAIAARVELSFLAASVFPPVSHPPGPVPLPSRNVDHFSSFGGAPAIFAFSTARFATFSTIQSKFFCPTECTSASGAGFMKSIAYGTPSSTANSTVFKS